MQCYQRLMRLSTQPPVNPSGKKKKKNKKQGNKSNGGQTASDNSDKSQSKDSTAAEDTAQGIEITTSENAENITNVPQDDCDELNQDEEISSNNKLSDIVVDAIISSSTKEKRSPVGRGDDYEQESDQDEHQRHKRDSSEDRSSHSKFWTREDEERTHHSKAYAPDSANTDYYCKICDSHMNSWDMWMAHISGKRHLKTVKKDSQDDHFSQKAMKLNSNYAKLNDIIEDTYEPIVGLDFMRESQKTGVPILYNCYLCNASLNTSNVVDHLLTTKHRLAYLKNVDPQEHGVISGLDVSKKVLEEIAAKKAAEWEEKNGRGKIEVRREIDRQAYWKARAPRRSSRTYPEPEEESDASDSDHNRYGRSHAKRKNSRDYSPEFSPKRHRMPHTSRSSGSRMQSLHSPLKSMAMKTMVNHLQSSANDLAVDSIKKASNATKFTLLPHLVNLEITSAKEMKDVMDAMNSLSESLLRYKMSTMPVSIRKKLALEILQQPDDPIYEPAISTPKFGSPCGSALDLNYGNRYRGNQIALPQPIHEYHGRELPPMCGIMSWPEPAVQDHRSSSSYYNVHDKRSWH